MFYGITYHHIDFYLYSANSFILSKTESRVRITPENWGL